MDNNIYPNITADIIHHRHKFVSELITRNNYRLDNSNHITTTFIDPYRKTTSSMTYKLKYPPTLSQLLDKLFDSYKVNMKY